MLESSPSPENVTSTLSPEENSIGTSTCNIYMYTCGSLLKDCKGEGKLCRSTIRRLYTKFQELSLRPVISVTCVMCPLPVTPAQLMKPGIGRNASYALGDFHF